MREGKSSREIISICFFFSAGIHLYEASGCKESRFACAGDQQGERMSSHSAMDNIPSEAQTSGGSKVAGRSNRCDKLAASGGKR